MTKEEILQEQIKQLQKLVQIQKDLIAALEKPRINWGYSGTGICTNQPNSVLAYQGPAVNFA